MNAFSERCVLGALRVARELGGAAGAAIEELLRLAIDAELQAGGVRVAATVRKRKSRSGHSDNVAPLSLSDLNTKERVSERQAELPFEATSPRAPVAVEPPPIAAALGETLPSELAPIAERAGVRRPSECWRKFALYKRDKPLSNIAGDWERWCLNERDRAPPAEPAPPRAAPGLARPSVRARAPTAEPIAGKDVVTNHIATMLAACRPPFAPQPHAQGA